MYFITILFQEDWDKIPRRVPILDFHYTFNSVLVFVFTTGTQLIFTCLHINGI